MVSGNNSESVVQYNPNLQLILQEFLRNIRIEDPLYSILVILYTILIIIGISGNLLILTAVIKQPAMRTLRNLFIVNLAISDLLLCIITMPLTLTQILTKFWPFGKFEILCKLSGASQAVSVYVSTISILAIALDRYKVIRYPTGGKCQNFYAAITLVSVWLLAILFASPIYLYIKLDEHSIPKINLVLYYCTEEWPSERSPFYYSVFSICFQYILPLTLVSIIHVIIHYKLKNRVITSMTCNKELRFNRENRLRRINNMLVCIAVTFGVSWLPLNIFNIYVDYYWLEMTYDRIIIFAFCHIVAMTSACTNFMIYGFLNKNFRREFSSILMDNLRQKSQVLQDIKSNFQNDRNQKISNATVLSAVECKENLLGKNKMNNPVDSL